jgi:hypothetical protein
VRREGTGNLRNGRGREARVMGCEQAMADGVDGGSEGSARLHLGHGSRKALR